MRLHGILMTRDDDDIVEQCIRHALTWCDALYVYDTGSSDSTPEIVAGMAHDDPRIIRVNEKIRPVLMDSGLRGYVFERKRHCFEPGDWIVQVDVDEFYHDEPRTFIATHLRRCETAVWNRTYEFRLTNGELRAWAEGRETVEDRQRPIMERRRYYNVLKHSEPRLFRYRRSMQWPPTIAYPYNMGFVACERIAIRHYPQRDPLQLKKRWLLRRLLAPLSDPNWQHWRHGDWTDLVATEGATDLYHWAQGTTLPVFHDQNHLPSWPKRGMQRLIHSAFLPLLDATRKRIAAGFEPPLIPDELQERIVRELHAMDLPEAGQWLEK